MDDDTRVWVCTQHYIVLDPAEPSPPTETAFDLDYIHYQSSGAARMIRDFDLKRYKNVSVVILNEECFEITKIHKAHYYLQFDNKLDALDFKIRGLS
jgi:hypothetical protein